MSGDDVFKTGGGLDGLQDALAPGADPLIGQSVGNYRIEDLIAEGGMGRVYRGRRDDGQFDRAVAVKILPPGLGDEYIRRFEQERQILASLTHAGIAQLLDAGLSDSGSLYLVMELVDGMPIDEYARSKGLDIRAKTRLMLTLCGALGFAHSRLVVHRDLKPSNVFVTKQGDLKLLDFGIAKILEAPDSVTVESRPMTPRYASPEQLLDEPISVASDIYQFGLLFLSLFEQRGDVAPETRASATERAVRKTSVTVESRVAGRLPPELVAILNKCLRAEPAERYASATDLASDLRNYLGGFPVNARNPGIIVRAYKFLVRNWLPTSAIALAFLSLVLLLAMTVRQQALTQAALDRAERQQARAESTTEFLVDLFDANRPSEALGETLSARDILQRGRDKLAKLDDEPALKADLLDTVAGVYRNLGDHETALQLARDSLAIKQDEYADEPLEIAATLGLIGRLENWFGDYEAALTTGRRIYDIYVDELGEHDERTLDALYVVGTALQRLDRYDEAEQALTAVLEGKRAIYGENHPNVTTAINNLAVVNGDRGNFDEAVKLMEEVIRWNEVQLPPDHPWAAMDWHNYGGFLSNVGRFAEAEAALRTSLAIREKVLDDDHPMVAYSLQALGVVVERMGRLREAEEIQERALEKSRQVNAAPHPYLAATLVSLGALKHLLGESRVGENYILDAAAQYRALEGQISYAHTADLALVRIRLDQGRNDEALQLLDPIIASGSTIPQLYLAGSLKARALRQLGRLAEAGAAIDDAVGFLEGRVYEGHPGLVSAMLEKSRILLDQGRAQEALAIATSAMESNRRSLPADHWQTAVASALRAEARLALGDDTAGLEELDAALARLEAALPDDHHAIVRARRVRDS